MLDMCALSNLMKFIVIEQIAVIVCLSSLIRGRVGLLMNNCVRL
jgi:hypothetical protein